MLETLYKGRLMLQLEVSDVCLFVKYETSIGNKSEIGKNRKKPEKTGKNPKTQKTPKKRNKTKEKTGRVKKPVFAVQ